MRIEDVLSDHGISGGGSNIKSVQKGLITLTGVTTNISISAIDPLKSLVFLSLKTQIGNPIHDNVVVKAIVTSPTNLELSITTYSSTSKVTVEWEVIEFNNVKSKQSGDVSFISGVDVSKLITISEVNVNKIMKTINGTYATNSTHFGVWSVLFDLQNSTTLSVERSSNSGNSIFHWEIIEFN